MVNTLNRIKLIDVEIELNGGRSEENSRAKYSKVGYEVNAEPGI